MVSNAVLHWLHKPELRLDLVGISEPNLVATWLECAANPKHNKFFTQSIFNLDLELRILFAVYQSVLVVR